MIKYVKYDKIPVAQRSKQTIGHSKILEISEILTFGIDFQWSIGKLFCQSLKISNFETLFNKLVFWALKSWVPI